MTIYRFSDGGKTLGRPHMLAAVLAALLLTLSTIPARAQEELPDPGIQLPSVSEYRLPPAEPSNPQQNPAEGPSDENAPPPQPVAPESGNPAVTSPPVATPQPQPIPTQSPSPAANPSADRRTEPVTSRQAPSRQPAQPRTTAPTVDTATPSDVTTTDPVEASEASGGELSAPIPSPDIPATESEAEPETTETSVPGWLLALGVLLVAGIAGLFFWRRKQSSDAPIAETATNSAAPQEKKEQEPQSEPAPQKIRPTAKIYSPPDPAKQNEPTPVSNDGFITTKVGLPPSTPAPAPRPAAVTTPAAKVPSAPSAATGSSDLKIEFFAENASSTLLNAVVGFRLVLTNDGKDDLKGLRIFGELIQADQNSAMIPALQRNNMVDQVTELPAGASVEIPGEVRLPLNAIRPISFKNQALFIPLARFEVEFQDDVGSSLEQAASFIVGQEHQPPRAKMAPFRLDLGPRNFEPVGQRAVQI